MTKLPTLNPEAIDNLRSLSPPGDASFLRELIDIYLADTPRLLTQLAAALDSGDAAIAVRAAHTIKGSSGNFGATALTQVALQLESHAKAGRLTEAQAQMDALKGEFAAVAAALRQLVRE